MLSLRGWQPWRIGLWIYVLRQRRIRPGTHRNKVELDIVEVDKVEVDEVEFDDIDFDNVALLSLFCRKRIVAGSVDCRKRMIFVARMSPK